MQRGSKTYYFWQGSDELLQKVNNAIQIYSKLKAIDAVSLSKQVAKEEMEQLIDSLVQDEQIKDILKKFEFMGVINTGQTQVTRRLQN